MERQVSRWPCRLFPKCICYAGRIRSKDSSGHAQPAAGWSNYPLTRSGIYIYIYILHEREREREILEITRNEFAKYNRRSLLADLLFADLFFVNSTHDVFYSRYKIRFSIRGCKSSRIYLILIITYDILRMQNVLLQYKTTLYFILPQCFILNDCIQSKKWFGTRN